jgi:hypothetical protein
MVEMELQLAIAVWNDVSYGKVFIKGGECKNSSIKLVWI